MTASIEATTPIELININPSQRRLCHERLRMKYMEPAMTAGWKVFWASVTVLAVAYGLAEWLVPNVVPVGYSEEPQTSWAVLTAFALRSIELTAAWVAVIALTLLCGAWLLARLRGRPARLTR
jgi:hypothetical protein